MVLKPINKAELTETLEKLKDKIGQRQESERDKQALIQKAQKNEDYMRSKLLTQLLNGEQVSLTEEILQNQYGITLKAGLIQPFSLKMDCEEEALGTSSVSVLMEKALEILDRNLREKGLDPIMECQGFYCIGLLNYESRQQEDVRRILKNALSQLELQKAIFKSVEFSLALGKAVRRAEELEDAGTDLSRLICQRLVKGSGRILEQQENYASLQGERLLEKYIREITHAAEVMSTDLADEAAMYLQKKVSEARNPRGCDILDLVYSAADVFTACIQLANRTECLEAFRRQCEQCASVEKLFATLREFQQKYIREIEEKRENDRVRPIRRAKEYVHNHYQDEGLSLDDICETLGISNSYFSSVFKKDTGNSFIGYLTEYRMEKAARMLVETTEKSYMIAKSVGYTDANYFSYVFKRQYGVSPSKYRSEYVKGE